jgi:hypothetical protein
MFNSGVKEKIRILEINDQRLCQKKEFVVTDFIFLVI